MASSSQDSDARISSPQFKEKPVASRLPSLRAQILDRLMARSQWTNALLAAIEANVVSPSEVDARLRQQLLTHRDAAIREQAAKLLAPPTTTTRSQVLAEYSHFSIKESSGSLPGRMIQPEAENTLANLKVH